MGQGQRRRFPVQRLQDWVEGSADLGEASGVWSRGRDRGRTVRGPVGRKGKVVECPEAVVTVV